MLKHVRTSQSWDDKNIGQKGFTLIELLVVIIILGVLAGIVVLSVTALRTSSEKSKCTTEKKTAESAAQAFYADQDPNKYPLTSDELHPTYMEEPGTDFAFDANGKVTTAC
ncbi:MAG TPA: prepilin-type N-terminal cleavage/methylation domain-containing protein [Iamia sp.]|nr:prepilin-type N-terminal cleavage/methylation domain-containing protein [Iamia sp.]